MTKGTPNARTMAELAELAGCSTMTVSYALRNHPKVSKATCERIQALAVKHGYRKHPMVSALMASRRKPEALGNEPLALLTKFDEPIFSWTERRVFFSDLLEGMLERADELGFRLEEFPCYTPNAPKGDRLRKILRTRGIRGILLMPGGGMDRPYTDADLSHTSVVAAAFHARNLHLHRSASDYNAGMGLCLQEAERRGYRRIGLAMNRRLDPEVRYAFSGRFLSWREMQPESQRVPLIEGEDSVISPEVFLAWLKRLRPDCVLCMSENLARVAEGLPAKKRPGIVLLPTRGNRHFSGLDARPHDVGRTTVNLMARELYLNHTGTPPVPEVVLVEGVWQEGNTLPPR